MSSADGGIKNLCLLALAPLTCALTSENTFSAPIAVDSSISLLKSELKSFDLENLAC